MTAYSSSSTSATPNITQILGQWAEDCACFHLQQHGWHIVARNFHSRYGELDIIAQRQHTLAFVEVKARTHQQYGTAVEMLSPAKQKKLMKTALYFMQQHEHLAQLDYRFDLFAIQFQHSNAYNVQCLQHNHPISYQYEWIEHAFCLELDAWN